MLGERDGGIWFFLSFLLAVDGERMIMMIDDGTFVLYFFFFVLATRRMKGQL